MAHPRYPINLGAPPARPHQAVCDNRAIAERPDRPTRGLLETPRCGLWAGRYLAAGEDESPRVQLAGPNPARPTASPGTPTPLGPARSMSGRAERELFSGPALGTSGRGSVTSGGRRLGTRPGAEAAEPGSGAGSDDAEGAGIGTGNGDPDDPGIGAGAGPSASFNSGRVRRMLKPCPVTSCQLGDWPGKAL
jgi:hypothetical protein